ncbi:MAG TPA: diguanylate cyclase [Ilumatobacteraceae bacterium]|nr:diguanylate cyclase [Ilumatobacteraceae bacterium]
MILLLAVFAKSITHDTALSREALDERFQSRAHLSAAFVTGYVDDLATRERDQAIRLLSGTDVSATDFETIVQAFDLDVAGLFDAQGRMLAAWPASPDLLGEQFGDRSQHIATALTGSTGVSGVVASAVSSQAVVALAVPFDTPSGRRVFNGAIRPSTGSLRVYFDTVIPLAGRTYLIDRMGNTVVSGKSGERADLTPTLTPGQLLQLDESIGALESDGTSLTYVREPVAGTAWHVILTTPSSILYAPIEGGSHVSWLLFVAFAFTGLVGLVLYFRLARLHSAASTTARFDELTQLPNRRAAEEHLQRTASAASRHSQPYGVLMIDIDRFKDINDTYGHETGDRVLGLVARTLRAAARVEDVVCRWGGEEFLVILPATSERSIAAVAERYRAAVALVTIRVGADQVNATISIGGVVSTDGTIRAGLNAADAALYAAKLAGRNRVVINRDGAVHFVPAEESDTTRWLAEVGL